MCEQLKFIGFFSVVSDLIYNITSVKRLQKCKIYPLLTLFLTIEYTCFAISEVKDAEEVPQESQGYIVPDNDDENSDDR